MQSELWKLIREELALRDRINAKIKIVYARGSRARYSTFNYAADVEIIDVRHDGKVKICNLQTRQTRWVDGRSRDLVWVSAPPAPEAAVQG